MKQQKPLKASHRLYQKYEYLAEIYANKLFNTNSIGMDRDDIVQELKLKIFTSIKGYGKRWSEYQKTGNYKPVPIEYYLKAALNNKLKDMVDDINKDVNQFPLSIQTTNFDYGVGQTELNIMNFEKREVVIGGVDILKGLKDKERDAFCLYLKGHSLPRIEKLFKDKIQNISIIIKNHVEILREQKDELLQGTQRITYSYQLQEEDN